MAGNVRFELASASPEESGFSGNFPNGQRGNYPGASLDRSGSFQEGSEGQMFSSGTGLARGNATSIGDLPLLSQCLTLEPITMGDQKYTRLVELRRALGFSFGSTAEYNSFGAAQAKPPPQVALEELKQFKESVAESSTKARVRAKMFDEALDGLNTLARGNATSTGDLPSFSQRLTLEPIRIRDRKWTRLVELGRALRSTAEGNSFGAAHAKPPPPVAMEELKRFKESVAESSTKARVRTKMFDEDLDGLNTLARGNATSTGDFPSLSQCLTLEPITMGDQKFTRLVELRRALEFSFGSTVEDNSFGAAHANPPPPVALEELKRFKERVAKSSTKARVRTKMFDEALDCLKYYESRNSKKRQRNELFRSERSGGSNLLKFGTQIQRNTPDLVIQRLEDRAKNGVQNKHVCTSIAEIQVKWDEPASIFCPDAVSTWELEPLAAATPSNAQPAQQIKRAQPPVLPLPSRDLSVLGMAALPAPSLNESISSMTPTPLPALFVPGMAALSTSFREESVCSESICSN